MFLGGGGGIGIFVLIMLFSFAMRRGGSWGGRGPWGGSGRPYGGGPYGGGPYGGAPYPPGGPYGGSPTNPSGPTSSGGNYSSSGGGPGYDPATVGETPGAPTGGSGGWFAGDWRHDDRPAAASIPGELFPQTHADTGQAANPLDSGLAAIRAHDPAFNIEEFTQRVQRVFFIVEEAWSQREPGTSRQVMADNLWQEHQVQIQGYVNAHKHNMLDNLSVANIWPVAAHSDTSFDLVTVRIVAASTDYDVDDATGRLVRGNKDIKQWQEDWTFQRSSSATTQVGGTTLGSKCPNCGAPLDVDLTGTCRYCKTLIMSGQYDWVLSRISQVG